MSPAALSVLVVEDVDEMREMIGQLISGMEGFKLSGLARNGWEARLELGRRQPSLVLLDEVLPGESSADLLTEIVALGVPCLLMTGVMNPTHAILAEAAGRVIKPSWETLEDDQERLRNELLQALGRSSG